MLKSVAAQVNFFFMTHNIKILAIESSCDETAAAVIGEKDDCPVVLSSIISSQIDLHAKTGGVVPEVASRAHMEAITPVVVESLTSSGDVQSAIKALDGITHIAVTAGPGLIGSLLVGFNAAKTIAYAKNLPIVPINHIEGHIYSAFSREISNSKFLISKQRDDRKLSINENWKLKNEKLFPVIALTVSGGHTSLTLMKDHGVYENIGETLDDAVGEAYDKTAKLLGLGYPGGPAISKLAAQFRNKFSIFNPPAGGQFSNNREKPIVLPRPIINDGTFNFSFSGLKTAVLILTKKMIAEQKLADVSELDEMTKAEIAAAFEAAVADVLVTKSVRAIEKYQPKSFIFAGGVSVNQYLQDSLKFKVKSLKQKQDIEFLTPAAGLYGDNAAMIGLAAFYHIKRNDVSDWNSIQVDANLELV